MLVLTFFYDCLYVGNFVTKSTKTKDFFMVLGSTSRSLPR